ncbi:MAG: glycosyltransferase family 2 protein [Actinomycetota bacterium]|nr:glycosyltransferase family 2 protein [Actinomycetota bacterium]
MLRCHRDGELVGAIVRLMREQLGPVVVTADSRMDRNELAAVARAEPDELLLIDAPAPNERGNEVILRTAGDGWILRMCGDEWPSLELMRQLPRAITPAYTHGAMPVLWLWPGAVSYLAQAPWWPEQHRRAFRADATLRRIPGVTHGGHWVVGPCFDIEHPIYHLDLPMTSRAEREVKANRYEGERPGLTIRGGRSLNATMYLPEAADDLRTARVPEEDRALLEEALALAFRTAAPRAIGFEPRLIGRAEVDATWLARPEQPSADLLLPPQDLSFTAHRTREVLVEIAVGGTMAVEWSIPPHVSPSLEASWVMADGSVSPIPSPPTPIPGRILPGRAELALVPATAPTAGGATLRVELRRHAEVLAAVQHPITIEPAGRRLLAVVQARDEERYLPGLLANLAPQVDGIVALDDGSIDSTRAILDAHPAVVEVLTRERADDVWDEPGNMARLLDAAHRHGADWVLAIDADERVERGFRARAELVLDDADARGGQALMVRLLDLWDAPDLVRMDGGWGTARRARLVRGGVVSQNQAALHGSWAPPGNWPPAPLLLYHLRMIDPLDRQARRDRYEELDPDRRWQPSYAPLTDETGRWLVPLERGREYEPWPDAGPLGAASSA